LNGTETFLSQGEAEKKQKKNRGGEKGGAIFSEGSEEKEGPPAEFRGRVFEKNNEKSDNGFIGRGLTGKVGGNHLISKRG